jgi:ubiquinone/menaquinone biosynthesis C-methylase UbiE
MSRNAVRTYYASFGEREWQRLETLPEGQIEFAVTQDALETHLPKGGRVLDVGGGPGRWAIWLAQRGYIIVLADLSPNLLEIAREQITVAGIGANVEDVIEADACDLSRFEDESFDAALCLGPFYHLPETGDRIKAARELRRVLKPNGILVAALMTRYSFLRRTIAIADERRHLIRPDFVEHLMQEGKFINDIDGRFDAGYGFLPQEVRPFFDGFGFQQKVLLACEGIASGIERVISPLRESDPAVHARFMQLVVQTASDPSILGLSSHLLYIGQKR